MGVKKNSNNSNDKTRRYSGTFKVLRGACLQFAKSFSRVSGCEWGVDVGVSVWERAARKVPAF